MAQGALGFANWTQALLFAHDGVSLYREAQDVLRLSVRAAETEDTSHKGRKPLPLLLRLLELFTALGETVLDPFLGSGTTLFAAEACGRVCVVGEWRPDAWAEIIARYERATESVHSLSLALYGNALCPADKIT